MSGGNTRHLAQSKVRLLYDLNYLKLLNMKECLGFCTQSKQTTVSVFEYLIFGQLYQIRLNFFSTLVIYFIGLYKIQPNLFCWSWSYYFAILSHFFSSSVSVELGWPDKLCDRSNIIDLGLESDLESCQCSLLYCSLVDWLFIISSSSSNRYCNCAISTLSAATQQHHLFSTGRRLKNRNATVLTPT